MKRLEQGPSSELLTIKQAAQYLRVSEVSLRRWTDSGDLPCLRVGGRRERRFRTSDLNAFLDGRQAGANADADIARPQACLDGLAIPYGRHLCAFYTSVEGRDKLALPFLLEGLARRERCFLIADVDTAQSLMRALEPSATETLVFKEPTAEPEDVLDYFRLEFAHTTRERYAPLRVLGDMAGFLHAGASPAALLDFELRFDRELAHKYPVVSLCQYDARVFSGVAVLAALECHSDLFEFPLRNFLGN